MRLPVVFIFAGLFSISAWSQQCGSDAPDTVHFQVLGSGGPIADDARASSSYLIWDNGAASALVDIGGGSILRFAEANASIDSLQAIAITHTHIDHIGDLPALVKSAYFSSRRKPLPIIGPGGSDLFPSISEYIDNTFINDNATHRYLSGIADGSKGQFAMPVTTVDKLNQVSTVFRSDSLTIRATGVAHAIVPAIGYVLETDNKKIAIPGDTSADIEQFIELAQNADILVLHLAIPESATGAANRLHARPSEMGQIAARINPGRLIVSHIMQRAERDLEDVKAQLRKSFSGKLDFATDLACYAL